MDHDKEVAPVPDLSSLLEHVLLRPEFSEEDVARGCDLAKQHQVAAVIVRPSDVELAARWGLASVALGTVVDWPEGYSATGVKTFAVRDMLRRGVKEIDTVMNTGKLISRQFQYLEVELLQMADTCHQSGAILKVMLQGPLLNEELKIVACRVCRRAGVDFIGSTTESDLPLLKEYSKEKLKLKAQADSLDDALRLRDFGCERLQSENTAGILATWAAKFAEDAVEAPRS